MVNTKENLWMVALLAGILGIITIFTPAWGSTSEGALFWFWNLYVDDGHVDFIESGSALYNLGIATTLILVIGTALLLFIGLFAKIKDRQFEILGIISGIILIIGPIVFFVGVESEYPGFLSGYDVNVALILPFIAGALGVFAGVMGIIENR